MGSWALEAFVVLPLVPKQESRVRPNMGSSHHPLRLRCYRGLVLVGLVRHGPWMLPVSMGWVESPHRQSGAVFEAIESMLEETLVPCSDYQSTHQTQILMHLSS